MKIADRLTVILFVLCLIFASVAIPINIIVTRDVYYINQFKKCGIYPEDGQTVNVRYIGGNSSQTAEFTNDQLEEIVSHITAYFAHEKDSFALKMNGVILNGKETDQVDIFGEEAVTHMDDVKILFSILKTATAVAVSVLVACAVYMLLRKATVRKLIYKYSFGTVLGFALAFVLFFLFVFVKLLLSGDGISLDNYLSELWVYMHHIFFPFNHEKFGGSFFNDTLTQILTLDFFMNTVQTIVINIVALTTAWLISAKIISRK